MNVIVAIDKKNCIGKNKDLLYRISSDLKNFKNLTTGKIVFYGYNTLESFPNQKPLKNRINIILTHKEIQIEGAIIVHSIEEAFKEFKKYDTNDIFIIGGESIYRQFTDYCDKCFLTTILNNNKEGNKYFPDISTWKIVNKKTIIEEEYIYSYTELINPNTKKY